MSDGAWVIAWIEHYRADDRLEARMCCDVDEAVEEALCLANSDDSNVGDIETQNGLLSDEEWEAAKARVRARWAERAAKIRPIRPPNTHRVDLRDFAVHPRLSEDWRIWAPHHKFQSLEKAQKYADEWIARIGADRVRIVEIGSRDV